MPSPGGRTPATKGLIDAFGGKIQPYLKSFDKYPPGHEIKFIDNTIDMLDCVWAGQDQQSLFIKCKKAHGWPQIESPSLSNDIELADLLIVATFFEDGDVAHRQGFFSQSKCISTCKTGYAEWEIDATQYAFLTDRPQFQLAYDSATTDYNMANAPPSFLNYSLVSNVHRPFFYNPKDMVPYIERGGAEHTFIYGRKSGFAATADDTKHPSRLSGWTLTQFGLA